MGVVVGAGEEGLEFLGEGLADVLAGFLVAAGEEADGEVDESGAGSGASGVVLVDVGVGFDGLGFDGGAVGEFEGEGFEDVGEVGEFGEIGGEFEF